MNMLNNFLAGTSVFDTETLKLITDGFADGKATVIALIGIAVAAGIAIVTLDGGADYAIKKIKSVIRG